MMKYKKYEFLIIIFIFILACLFVSPIFYNVYKNYTYNKQEEKRRSSFANNNNITTVPVSASLDLINNSVIFNTVNCHVIGDSRISINYNADEFSFMVSYPNNNGSRGVEQLSFVVTRNNNSVTVRPTTNINRSRLISVDYKISIKPETGLTWITDDMAITQTSLLNPIIVTVNETQSPEYYTTMGSGEKPIIGYNDKGETVDELWLIYTNDYM